MLPQCGHTGPLGQTRASRYWRAVSASWKCGWFRSGVLMVIAHQYALGSRAKRLAEEWERNKSLLDRGLIDRIRRLCVDGLIWAQRNTAPAGGTGLVTGVIELGDGGEKLLAALLAYDSDRQSVARFVHDFDLLR